MNGVVDLRRALGLPVDFPSPLTLGAKRHDGLTLNTAHHLRIWVSDRTFGHA
jgi:hypothetical protein